MSDIKGILELLERLEDAKIYYSLEDNRSDAISVNVVVPGQRWEIDYLADGTIEVEVFESGGEIFDQSKLSELFKKFSD